MRGRTRKITRGVIDFVIADITLRHPGKAHALVDALAALR
jgi:hypothetical protein